MRALTMDERLFQTVSRAAASISRTGVLLFLHFSLSHSFGRDSSNRTPQEAAELFVWLSKAPEQQTHAKVSRAPAALCLGRLVEGEKVEACFPHRPFHQPPHPAASPRPFGGVGAGEPRNELPRPVVTSKNLSSLSLLIYSTCHVVSCTVPFSLSLSFSSQARPHVEKEPGALAASPRASFFSSEPQLRRLFPERDSRLAITTHAAS